MPRLLVRAAVLAVAWWSLSGGDSRSWIVGVPVVLSAALVSLALGRPSRWRVSPAGAVRFLPFFAWHALAGSVDVAYRAISPRLPIAPSFEHYQLGLPEDGPARVFFVNTVSLLPGTLSADLQGDRLTVHAISGGEGVHDRLHALETHVAAVFGRSLETPAAGDA